MLVARNRKMRFMMFSSSRTLLDGNIIGYRAGKGLTAK